MLLRAIPKTKALVVRSENMAQVMASVPSAEPLAVNGVDLLLVPHKVDAVRQLRSVGIDAPAPILHHYHWPGQFTPYEHQRMTAAFLTMHNRCIVLNEIGTGKTQSALWAADYLIQTGQISKALIVSPLSTLERVWGDAIAMNFPHRKHVILHGTSKKRLCQLDVDADFYIINHDGLQLIADKSIGQFDLLIMDEAAVLRNPSTARYKTMKTWKKNNPNARLWLMTGTPTPNAPTDAWTLAQLIDNPLVPGSYTAFRADVMVKVGAYNWKPRTGSAETVRQILSPAVRYTRDECFDLPDTVVQTRKVNMTREQQKHYDVMMRQMVIELQENDAYISAANEAIKLQKLVQIACGVAYADDKQHVALDCTPRISVVKDIIEEVGGKAILFAPLTGILRMLEQELGQVWSCATVDGSVSLKKRNNIFQSFQTSAEPHVLIAHPATMSHGLTLTAASTVIWYGPVTSNEQYVQANGRVERIGKRHVSNVVHIEATALEHKMYRRLASKQKLQGTLLDLIQQEME